MKRILTLLLVAFNGSAGLAQFTGFSAVMDTIWHADGSDEVEGLEFYGSYSIYAEFTSSTDVLSALYSDVQALATPAAGIESTCGCFESAIAASPWLWDINPDLIPSFPGLQYSTGWTIGMNNSGAPGTVHPLFQDFAPPCEGFTTTNGAMFVIPEVNPATGLVIGPVEAMAGEDLKVLVARVTTCGEFTLQSCVLTIPGGDQSVDSYVCAEPFTVIHPYQDGECLNDADGDGVCDEFEVSGCMDTIACNYDMSATDEDGSCDVPVAGCEECVNGVSTAIDANGNGEADCDETVIEGCTIEFACNYNPDATNDDGSCDFLSCIVYGCTQNGACNFDPEATVSDGSCEYLSCQGCLNPSACNYDDTATIAGICDFTSCVGCVDPEADNYDATATIEGSCDYLGCTSFTACNYDPNANVNDGSCEFLSCVGCLNSSACNYDANATQSGSCIYPLPGFNCDGTCIDTDMDGVCDFDEVYGCTAATACNYNVDATEDDSLCVFPGGACQDDNEATFDDAYNDDCECVGVDFLETCDYIGHPEWLNMELGVYSSEFSLIDSSFSLIDSSLSGIWLFGPGYNLIVGEAFETELVLNMPLVFTDEVTGGSFQVLSWSNLMADNVPPGVDLSVPETLEGGSQACLEMSGVDYPTEEGLFEVSIAGEVVMNFFGTPISIGDVSTSFLIQVSSNPNGVPGCMYETASNYMPWATFDVGICEFEGCTDPEALNFSSAHTLEDGSCLYTDPSGCDESEEDHQLCLEGTVWSEELGGCVVANVSDTDFDGCVGINDFLIHLSNFGSGCGSEPAWACGDPLEYQGYEYETVQIGEQCWFAENLRAENYRNGENILGGVSASDWDLLAEGAAAIYGEGSSAVANGNEDAFSNLSAHGRLYNFFAVSDERSLCPYGWQVPSTVDFEVLLEEVETTDTLKGFESSSGFNATFGGRRTGNGSFIYESVQAGYWTQAENIDFPGDSFNYILGQNESVHYPNSLSGVWDSTCMKVGFSVRCIKDTE
jgi:uncharacterized protein (TIGR02145 family)